MRTMAALPKDQRDETLTLISAHISTADHEWMKGVAAKRTAENRKQGKPNPTVSWASVLREVVTAARKKSKKKHA